MIEASESTTKPKLLDEFSIAAEGHINLVATSETSARHGTVPSQSKRLDSAETVSRIYYAHSRWKVAPNDVPVSDLVGFDCEFAVCKGQHSYYEVVRSLSSSTQPWTRDPSSSTKTLPALEKLRDCRIRSSAYTIAGEILDQVDGHTVVAISRYLEDESNSWRSVLMSRMADDEFTLSEPLAEAATRLLMSRDVDVAQSAALALFYGGDQSRAQLSEHLSESIPHREQIRNLLAIVG